MQLQGLARLDLHRLAHCGRADMKGEHRPVGHEGSARTDRIKPRVGGERSFDLREEPDGASWVYVGVVRTGNRGKAEPEIQKVVPRVDAKSISLKHLHHVHDAEWHVECEPGAFAEPVTADVRVAAH